MSPQRAFCTLLFLLSLTAPARAYIDVTPTLGRLIRDSSHIVVLRVEKVSQEKRAILFHKVADLKGETSAASLKHQLTAGFHPREAATILEWAEPGQLAISFQNGKAAEVCIGRYWYECYAGPEDWWVMNCGQAQLSFAYSGTVTKLRDAVATIVAGKEALITAVKFTADDAYWRECKRVIAARDLPQGNQFPVHRFQASLRMANFIYEMARDPKFVSLPGAASAEEVPALITALKDPHWQARADAAQTLATVGPAAKEALPALRHTLQDSKPLVRLRACAALAALDPKSKLAAPVLAALLKSPEATIRKGAAQALGDAGLDPAASVRDLIAVLQDEDAKVRWATVDALGRFGPPAAPAVPALIASLQDADTIVRSAAVDALGSIGPKAKAAIPFLTPLLQSAEKSQRPLIAATLYRIDRRKASAAIPVLIEELKENDTRLRWHALNYLRKMVMEAKDVVPVPLLIDALGDPDFGVRGMAAWILGEMGPPAAPAVPALTKALDVNDVWVRIATAPALVKILGTKAVMAISALIDGLRDDDEDGREECLRALQRLGPAAKEALPALRAQVKKETTLRPLVAETMWRISLDADVPVSILLAIVTGEDHAARRGALRILGDMGPDAKAAVPVLRELLEKDDLELCETCLECLRRIDPTQWKLTVERQQELARPWGWRMAIWTLLILLIGVPLGIGTWRAEPG